MEYFFFTICLCGIVWGVPRIGFIKRSGLTVREIRMLLVLKIIAGLLVAKYFKYQFEHVSSANDYIIFNENAVEHYRLLISHPQLFFNDFSQDIQKYGFSGLFEAKESFWAYARFNLLFKCIAVLDLITHGNFYLNTALFSSFVFFGHLAFFRIYYSIYNTHKWKILLASFCIPSLLMYTACIHKDGIIFLCLALISYVLYRYISGFAYFKSQYILVVMLGLLSIFLFRNYVLVALLPAMLIGILSAALPWKRLYIFCACYIAFIFLFFMTGFTKSSFNLPAAVVQRKSDFAMLTNANTNIKMNELQPHFISFIKNVPQALNHYFCRPYLLEFSQFSILLAALELSFYQLLFLLFIIYPVKKRSVPNPFNLFGLALFINMVLIIGYTIPNIGAIVRYRSIFWIFVLCPLICNIDWERLNFFNKNTTPDI